MDIPVQLFRVNSVIWGPSRPTRIGDREQLELSKTVWARGAEEALDLHNAWIEQERIDVIVVVSVVPVGNVVADHVINPTAGIPGSVEPDHPMLVT